MADIPAGLPSDVLVRRPDVRAAEHTLQAQNANIGAARAAFFPRISLTGSAGTLSPDLSGLFGAGTRSWSFAPQIVLPLFAGGANIANLRGAEAQRDAAVATYEKAIQTAFREVADALAVRATISDRVSAQERLVEAASATQRLSQARYDRGVDSYLTLLDAQRTLYAARQTLLAAQLAQGTNRIELYRALGGGAPAV
jgi:multidrug efflux system outer membrane protein